MRSCSSVSTFDRPKVDRCVSCYSRSARLAVAKYDRMLPAPCAALLLLTSGLVVEEKSGGRQITTSSTTRGSEVTEDSTVFLLGNHRPWGVRVGVVVREEAKRT